MKLIVAGGSGLIGQALTKDLVSQGHQVWVLSRNPANTNLPDGVLAAGWDAKTPKGWEHLVSQADGIINLAGTNIGERPWTNERTFGPQQPGGCLTARRLWRRFARAITAHGWSSRSREVGY